MSGAIYTTRAEIRALFQELGVTYLSRTRIDWEPLLTMSVTESPYYRAHQKIFDTLAQRYGRDIATGTLAPLYIKKIDETIGFGVFAAEALKKDDFIGEYAGVIQISGKYTHCYQAETGYESDYSWYYVDELEHCPPLEINARREGNEMRLINHSTRPNLAVEHTLYEGQWVLFFIAARDIDKDEQLLIHYGEAYWQEDYRMSEPLTSR